MCPSVGPEAESILSNCTLVTTLGVKLKPNSPRRAASNASNPGVRTTAADFEIAGLPALVVVDRPRLADLGAESALAGTKMDAVVAVDHRHSRRGLRMGQIDRGPGRQYAGHSRSGAASPVPSRRW